MTHPMMTDFNCRDTQGVFNSYPSAYQKKLLYLRELIFEVAKDMKLTDLEETLKWGEPSYLTKNGSTIRLAWRTSSPDTYAILFNCKTSLIETFREVYRGVFTFEGNRAIVFTLDDDLALDALKHCIELSLNYKRIKHLPLLGL